VNPSPLEKDNRLGRVKSGLCRIGWVYMSTNIEIKAYFPDKKVFQEKIGQLQCAYEGMDEQVDTFFETAAGRIKLRESSLKGVFLIPYIRPDREGPKTSDYALIEIADPLKVKQLLTDILGIKAVVKKKRQIYHYRHVRIHFDQVEFAGSFIELEALV